MVYGRTPMRWMALLALAAAAACGDDRCLPCKGAVTSTIRYMCDAGECASADSFYECTCRNGNNLSIWTAPTSTACENAAASWSAFKDANCR